jgi:hypothetical protein
LWKAIFCIGQEEEEENPRKKERKKEDATQACTLTILVWVPIVIP